MTTRMLVIDIETDGLLNKMTTVHCAVAKDIKTGVIYEYGPDQIEYFVRALEDNIVIGHNIINFDIPALWQWCEWNDSKFIGEMYMQVQSEIDTLVMSRLLNPDRERPKGLPQKVGPHSLEAWGMRLGFPKGDCESFAEYSEDMLEYCKTDVEVTHEVYKALCKEMSR